MHGNKRGDERTHCRLCQGKLHDILEEEVIYAGYLEYSSSDCIASLYVFIIILQYTEMRCIVHSFSCEAVRVTVRPVPVKKFLTRLVLEIIQPRIEARKIRYVSSMHSGY